MNGKTSRIAALLLLLFPALTPLFSQVCDCVSTGNCPVPIQDNGTFQGTLDVTVNGPNDLGLCPLTSVCFSITHTWVGDLAVTLTSPGGQNYIVMGDANNNFGGCGTNEDNIDVCIFPGTANPLTNNTEYICNTGPCASGTCCLTGFWTMPCNGVTDPVTGASQAPSCDLNDFNQGGQPANGTWTLTVNDICSQDVGTLNNFSLTFACGTLVCTVCEADGGALNAPDVEGCLGDPGLNLVLPPTFPGAPPNPADYSYAYVISQNGVISAINPTPNMSNQPPGVYSICGFSYLNAASSSVPTLLGMNLADAQTAFASATAPFCGDFSDDCILVTIGPAIPPTIIDTAVCVGECIFIGGQQLCSSGSVTLESYLGCDSVINVVFIPIIVQPSSAVETVCQGDCVILNGQVYCPPGPHLITYESWQGCDSLVTLTFDEIVTVAIIIPVNPPPLSCSSPALVLDGSSSVPANVSYSWTGPGGFASQDAMISVDAPGTYMLTVFNNDFNPPCIATNSVEVTGNLNPPNLVVTSPPPTICAGQSFDLATLSISDLNGNNPTITFHSGTPATPANQLANTNVSPATTTTYYILGTSGSCTDETSVIVTVANTPTAAFNATSPICSTNASVVTYTGNAGAGAIFNWNFNGGTATPGVGQGPHLVQWASAGSYTVSLTVSQNGCTSQPAQQTVQVDAPLAAPNVSCGAITPTSVEFVWNNVPGATGYNVTVISGQTGTQNGNSFIVNNLTPGTSVTIQVTALGSGACGNSNATFTCQALNCPPVSININPVADICLVLSAPTVDLDVTVTGGSGNGVGTWSGTGITNATSGIFDPNVAGASSHVITYNYSENSCPYSGTTTIDVFATPTSSFTASSPICENGSTLVTYTGNAGAGATFNWNFGGGTATPGTGAGPHTVEWATSGTQTITLLVQENGCPSQQSSQTVQVQTFLEEPVLNCSPTLNSIQFTWAAVPGATSYNVTVLTGQTGTLNGATSYLVSGLTTGENVTISVEAVSGNACPNTSAELTCTAQNCPAAIVTIDLVADICLDGSVAPFFLTASQTGGAGGGTFTWSGPGVVNPATGLFDPGDADFGQNLILVTYAEGTCIYNGSANINVFPQPTATFTVTTPICVSDASVVNYTGNASANATFTWDFGGGTATPGTGAGPHSVEWTGNGSYNITLMVEENGCASQAGSQGVNVEPPLAQPQITCNSTTSSVEFFWNEVPGAASYNVTVISGSGGVATSDTSYLFSNLFPNTQITIEVEVVGTGPCGNSSAQHTCTAQNCPNVAIVIAPVSGICLDGTENPFDMTAAVAGGAGGGTLVWSGAGITDTLNGTFDPAAAGAGSHLITAEYEEGSCAWAQDIIIDVFPPPVASFSVETPVCEGENSVIAYTGSVQPGLTYNWNFDGGTATPGVGQGPHNVSWAATGAHSVTLTVIAPNGCGSAPFNEVVTVEPALTPPPVSCNPTLNSIEFTWPDVPGATDYVVTQLSGSPGTQTSQNSFLITGLVPGDQASIELLVSSASGGCPPVSAQQTCVAMNCPDIVIDLAPLQPICLGAAAPLQLSPTVTGSDGSGAGTWSGNGISASGLFTPATAGVGQHLLTYTFSEGGCTFNGSTTITVNQTPTADFNATANICQTDAATIDYAGTASATATFDWDFGSGTATPGTGAGPHQVIWTASGTQTITLTVTENGCASSPETFDVQVDPTLEPPVITCTSTTQSVVFSWQAIPGATDYNVTVLSPGLTGSQTSQTSYSFNNLNPGQSVSIQITASGNTTCPPASAQATCEALDCPPVVIDLAPVAPICLVAGTQTIDLQATVSGGSGGTETWNGAGVTNASTGIFDPAAAGLGTHVISFSWQLDNCSFLETMEIQISPPPVADAGDDASLTCKEGETEAQLGGSATTVGANIAYDWDAAAGAFPADSTIFNPIVSEDGTYTLTVTNTLLGCSDSDVAIVQTSQDVPVPVISIKPISCFGKKDGVISVDSVAGGQAPYLFSMNGGPFTASSSYTHLEPGVYELVVLDVNGCERMLTIDIQQPQELQVQLIVLIEGDNIIHLGDSARLQALITIDPDSLDRVDWEPDSLLSCDTCLNPVAYPVTTATFSVTVESNGCSDSDAVTIFVQKDRQVYVPNAFSPNNDGNNDLFTIFGGPQVANIKSFLVFNRWGETVYEFQDFLPNNPANGWDGRHRGKLMNPAVFTWFAEVEFIDGETEIFEGDVTLLR